MCAPAVAGLTGCEPTPPRRPFARPVPLGVLARQHEEHEEHEEHERPEPCDLHDGPEPNDAPDPHDPHHHHTERGPS